MESDAESPLLEHLPERFLEADGDAIDWDALCRQIGTHRGTYEHPRTPDGEPGPWLDRLAVMQDAAMHLRDGGSIDVDGVVEA